MCNIFIYANSSTLHPCQLVGRSVVVSKQTSFETCKHVPAEQASWKKYFYTNVMLVASGKGRLIQDKVLSNQSRVSAIGLAPYATNRGLELFIIRISILTFLQKKVLKRAPAKPTNQACLLLLGVIFLIQPNQIVCPC